MTRYPATATVLVVALALAACSRKPAESSLVAAATAADLVVLSDNPITMDPARINEVQVLETIKEGRTVWQRQ